MARVSRIKERPNTNGSCLPTRPLIEMTRETKLFTVETLDVEKRIFRLDKNLFGEFPARSYCGRNSATVTNTGEAKRKAPMAAGTTLEVPFQKQSIAETSIYQVRQHITLATASETDCATAPENYSSHRRGENARLLR
ncbi:hypothetical protein BASA60_007775 [Batrachochytrium salamandrivorans]|nr:hypothetical protein BASA60_007775 [Batrachochytrium salamandrivorans]